MSNSNTLKIYERKSDGYKYFFVRKKLQSLFDDHQAFTLSCSDGTYYEDMEIKKTDDDRCFLYANDFFLNHPVLQKDDEVPFEVDNEKRLILNIKQWENHPEWNRGLEKKQQLVSSLSILQIIKNNLSVLRDGLKPYQRTNVLNYLIENGGERICIGLLLRDKDKNLVVVEVDKSEKEVLDKIRIVRERLAINGEKVNGIIIKESNEKLCTINKVNPENRPIETKYYHLGFSIHDKDSNEKNSVPIGQFEIMPDSEACMSNYLGEHSSLLGESLHGIKREYKVDKSGHKIDILCRDSNHNYVIIENKLNDSDYKVVGQVLYYYEQITKLAQEENKKTRAIILMAQKCQNSSNVMTVESALNCCQNCDILLKFYKTWISFDN